FGKPALLHDFLFSVGSHSLKFQLVRKFQGRSFCKHPDFQTEHEWRIVCNTSFLKKNAGLTGTDMLPDTKWRKGGYGLTPYRETVDVLDCVKEVIVGPGNADRDSIEYVKQFLRFSGVKAEVFLSVSPYR
ncbi:hypothetical protein, partial [Burkholderia pseudomallei]